MMHIYHRFCGKLAISFTIGCLFTVNTAMVTTALLDGMINGIIIYRKL